MKYGRIINAVVIETFTPPAGFTIADCFHPDVGFVEVPDDVEPSWLVNEDGTFSAPPQPPVEPETPPAA